jgi:hypothetical protein
MSLTGFHPLWDKILSQNLQAVADQGCHSEGSSPCKGTAYRGGILQGLLEWGIHSHLLQIVIPAKNELSQGSSSQVSQLSSWHLRYCCGHSHTAIGIALLSWAHRKCKKFGMYYITHSSDVVIKDHNQHAGR